jgi:epoxyqueuosine reductase
MSPADRTAVVRKVAAALGFDRCGITTTASIGRGDYVRKWLADGRAGTMAYLHQRADQRLEPASLLAGGRGVIAVALLYNQHAPPPPPDGQPRGRVAMYAWGDDYHDVLRQKLLCLEAELREALAEPFEARLCVDTAPVIERELAARAGLGWIGKNTLVLHQELGSYFFLGLMITTLELVEDEPAVDHCGTCTRCLEACPTDAFPAPYEMDASRCISYLTIERREPPPDGLARQSGDWVFGCDICQQVCPFNRDAPVTREPRFAPRSEETTTPKLATILAWRPEDYRRALAGSAMRRAKLDMLRRNARIAMKNGDAEHGAAEVL